MSAHTLVGVRDTEPVGRLGYDPAVAYQLTSTVIQRSASRVQIGSEPPGWVVLCDAPPETMGLLAALTGTVSAGQIIRDHGGDPTVWSPILESMLERGLLTPTQPHQETEWDRELRPEWVTQAQLHGPAKARRLLAGRAESMVIVHGAGRLPGTVAVLLAASGVGHVYQRLDRRLRPIDRIGAEGVAGPGAAQPHAAESSATADHWQIARRLQSVSPHVRTHPPATHHRHDLVLLASDVCDPVGDTGELFADAIPHLIATIGRISASVGPLVLPGRSTCLGCIVRHRRAADPELLPAGPRLDQWIVPPAALVTAVAATVTAELLALLDGDRLPATVDGTVEWQHGELAPRRRSWSPHPDCGCQDALRLDPSAGNPHGSPTR